MNVLGDQMRDLIEAAQEMGRETPDHDCEMTEVQRRFWNAVDAAKAVTA